MCLRTVYQGHRFCNPCITYIGLQTGVNTLRGASGGDLKSNVVIPAQAFVVSTYTTESCTTFAPASAALYPIVHLLRVAPGPFLDRSLPPSILPERMRPSLAQHMLINLRTAMAVLALGKCFLPLQTHQLSTEKNAELIS